MLRSGACASGGEVQDCLNLIARHISNIAETGTRRETPLRC